MSKVSGDGCWIPDTATRRRAAAWVPFIALCILRQYLEYGAWAALIMLGLMAVSVPAFLTIAKRTEGRLRSYLLATVILGWAALVALSSAPFAHTSNVGTATANSRSTTLGAAALTGGAAVVLAALSWRYARREKRQQRDVSGLSS